MMPLHRLVLLSKEDSVLLGTGEPRIFGGVARWHRRRGKRRTIARMDELMTVGCW
jgi:hypothetical protein